MVIRGKNERNPVLLWVTGVRACRTTSYRPESDNLEDLFTLVWWDQRGTALSFDPNIPPETMTIQQFVSDTLAVTDYLRSLPSGQDLPARPLLGSLIAIQAPPDHGALPRLPGMAQVVHQLESESSPTTTCSRDRRRGDTAIVRDLEAAPVAWPPARRTGYLKLRRKAMHRLGVGTTHDEVGDHRTVPAILDIPRHTLREKVVLWRGRAFSRSFGLWDQLIWIDLREGFLGWKSLCTSWKARTTTPAPRNWLVTTFASSTHR